MEETPRYPDLVLDVSTLTKRKRTQIDLRPDSAQTKALMQDLKLSGLRKVSLKGQLTPTGKHDFLLVTELGATAVQPCTITLEPVRTRIETEITRRFVADMPERGAEADAEEDGFGGTAMLEDDTIEPLGRAIDLWRVLSEALALELVSSRPATQPLSLFLQSLGQNIPNPHNTNKSKTKATNTQHTTTTIHTKHECNNKHTPKS